MKKGLKIFTYILLSLLLLIAALVIIASLSQNKIVDVTLTRVSESVNAPVEIEDLSFSLIKQFPYATIEISGVKIGPEKSKSLESKSIANESVININRAFISLKSIPLIRGEYEINDIEIDNATINYKIDSLGSSNIDFLLNYNEDETTSDSLNTGSKGSPYLDFKKVKLTNTTVYYVNDSMQFAANINIPSINFEGKVVNEEFTGTIEGDMQLSKCSFGNFTLKRMEEAAISFNLDYKLDTLEIKMLEANTDGANLEVSGKVAFSDKLFTNLAVELKSLELGKLQKYVPDELLNEYGIEDVNGIMNLSGTVKGVVSDSIMPSADFDFDLRNGFIRTKDYPIIKKINLEGKVSNGSERSNKTTSVNFKSFHAETESSTADLFLSLINIEKPNYTLKSKLKVNIEEFRDFIPDSIIQNISGEFIADFSTSGQIPDSIDDNFINHVVNNTSANVDFSNLQIEKDSLHINDLSGSLVYTPKKLILNNLNVIIPEWELQLTNSSFNAGFTGRVTQLQELGVTLNSFYAESPQGSFWGSAKIENLEYPDFVFKTKTKIDLTKLKPFIPDTLIKDISGNLEAEVSSQGKLNLDSVEYQINDIIFKQSKINLVAKNISVTMPDTLQELTNLNGEVKMDNDTISISKMSGIAAGIDFSIDSTTISNVYNAIIKNQNEKVLAHINLELGAIDYSTLIPLLEVDSSMQTNETEVRNFLFEVKGKIAAKSFEYDKIFLEDISAKFKLKDSVYIIDQFKTNAFDGSTNSSLIYSITKNNRQVINLRNDIQQMDIYKLLYAFDNFGQDSVMSYENISGIFSTDINSRFVFEADTLVTKDMRVLGNLVLKNGKLINYEPAMEVSNFTGIKELDNIEMKTLECNIFMFKNNIYVPITNIVSTSMDVSTFGMQSLDDNYEYHLHLKLGEILKGKSEKLIERQYSSGDEVSEDDIDRNTIKLIYGYNDGKKKLGFATRKAQKRMALKIKVQQKMLELIFHPILVSYETGVK